jgi:hypothetical protein
MSYNERIKFKGVIIVLQTKIINKKLQEKHPNIAAFAEGFTDAALVFGLVSVAIGYIITGKKIIHKENKA